MIAMSFAFSIIEEKQERTSEPLFATPVRTWESHGWALLICSNSY